MNLPYDYTSAPITGNWKRQWDIWDVPRKKVILQGVTYYLPQTMMTLPSVILQDMARIHEDRLNHDFPYWLYCKAPVRNKRGQIVRFFPNRPQLHIISKLEGQRINHKPVRLLVLKSRQFGSSTLAYSYIAWHQMRLHRGRSAWVVGLDLDQANDLIFRYNMVRQAHGLGWERYAQSNKARYIPERDAFVAAGSVERPNAPSGRSIQYAILSEVGKWPSTTKVSAERMAQNIGAMVPDHAGTIIVMESTAQAMTGLYFTKICRAAIAGHGSYELFFAGAALDDTLQAGPKHLKLKDLSREEVDYVRLAGASHRHLEWRRQKLNSPLYPDEWRLKEEYPILPEEAFQSGGSRIFHPSHVARARTHNARPLYRATVPLPDGDGPIGLTSSELIRASTGNLSIWAEPERGWTNRYVVGFDVGGTHKDSDYSSIRVLDRAGEALEVVAAWHGHLDHDLVALVSAQIASYYNNALLVPEINSLIADQGPKDDRDLDHGMTIIDAIKERYYNIYSRRVYDTQRKDYTYKLGFHTNKQSKSVLVNALKKTLREGMLIERSAEACAEFDIFIRHPDGRYGNQEGGNDDRVIATALAIIGHDTMPEAARKLEAARITNIATMADF